ncbi:MAG TPA: alpha/beta fold hydrolase, partial [Gaiellaceae bacterium]|nr:alpha/beta fold hydrolase [Gaiellaceae bacterium]
WPLDERMWQRQLEALAAAGYEAVAPRLYGRGPFVEGWAAQLLEEVPGPLVPVGASMGGYTALALARRAPERVLGIVLAGSRAAADTDERRRARDELIATLRTAGVPPELETDVPAEELAVALEALRDRPDASGTVAAFGGPLLVCAGDADEVVPLEEARALAASALLGSLEVFPGAGHLLTVEQPERFTAVLLDFLAQWRT